MPNRVKFLILKGLGWVFLSQGMTQSLKIAFSVILARLITPSEFGIMGMVMTFSGIVSLFQMQSFGSALIQKQDVVEGHKSSLFWLSIAAGILLATVMVIFAPWVGRFYKDIRVVPVARLLSITFVISSLGTVQFSLLSKTMNFKMLSLVDIVSSLIAGVCSILLAVKGLGVWSLVYRAIILASCRSLLLWILSGWHPRFLFRYSYVREMLGFSLYLQVSSFMNYGIRNLDNILVGRYLGSEQLGYYTRAYRLMRLPQQNLTNLIGRVFFPAFSTMQGKHEEIRAMYLRATRYIAFAAFPLVAGLIVVAPEFIILLYGDRWERTIFPFQILALLGATQSIGGLNGAIYLSQGRTKLQFYLRVFAFAVIAAAFVIGVRWNIEGVAIAYLAASVLTVLPGDYFKLRIIGLRMRTYYRNFLPMAVSSVVMGGAIWFMRRYLVRHYSSKIVILAGCTGIGAAVYFGLMFMIARPVLRELMNLLKEVVNLKNAKTEIEES